MGIIPVAIPFRNIINYMHCSTRNMISWRKTCKTCVSSVAEVPECLAVQSKTAACTDYCMVAVK